MSLSREISSALAPASELLVAGVVLRCMVCPIVVAGCGRNVGGPVGRGKMRYFRAEGYPWLRGIRAQGKTALVGGDN